MITPSHDVFVDMCALLGGVLDIAITLPVAVSTPRVSGANRQELPERFRSAQEITTEQAEAASALIERITSEADGHLQITLRALHAYQRSMSAFVRDDTDLAYSLLVVVLETLSLAQVQPRELNWKDYTPQQRDDLDSLFESTQDLPAGLDDEVRKILCRTKHLMASKRFRDFVSSMLPPDFFDAPDQVGPTLPLPRSRLRQMLTTAYDIRSGYVHALEPVSPVAKQTREMTEFACRRDGSLVLTFQGLHRIVRGVLREFQVRRVHPVAELPHPEMPGVEYARWSPAAWFHTRLPARNGSDTRVWIEGALWARLSEATPESRDACRRVRAHTLLCIEDAPKNLRSPLFAIAVLCGEPFVQGKYAGTLELLIAEVLTTNTISGHVKKPAKWVQRHLDGESPGLDLRIQVEVALMVALADKYPYESEERKYWHSLARDSCTFDRSLQGRFGAGPLLPNDIVELNKL